MRASWSITDSQNRCGSRSPRPTDTQATWSRDSSAWTQDSTSSVLPLPAGPVTSATPPPGTADSRSKSDMRRTRGRRPLAVAVVVMRPHCCTCRS
jgi:hypothetical protein